MATYLVTGGAGFIGSHLVGRLLRDGHQVRVLDDFSTGRRENLAFGPSVTADVLEVVEGDLRDPEVTAQVTAGVQGIYHLGAVPSVRLSVEDPVTTSEVNILGTLHLLKVADTLGVSRVVFASSSSVYGNADGRPVSEEEVGVPVSPYALSKKTGEDFMLLYSQLYGLETVSLRYFNVFGPRQDPEGEYAAVIPRFITFALHGEPLTIFGDGRQTRDFTYVENAVEATVLAMEAPVEGGAVFNVATGNSISLLELVAALEAIFGRKLEAVHLPARPGDVQHSAAKIDQGRRRLGYRPTVSFVQGLEYTVEAFRDTFSTMHASP